MPDDPFDLTQMIPTTAPEAPKRLSYIDPLNPEQRTLLQVKYSNSTKAKSKKDQDLIQVLMGDEVGPRKDFIINRALEVSNLDI